MSGHNKWSTIKHRKGAQDAKRSRKFTKIIKEITIAAKMGGGDPDGNPRLRRALDVARVSNMPRDNIERAIKKGTGELEGVNYEELVYEGVGPGGTLYIFEALTDNRNRSAAELRKVFEKNGGQLGASGSAAWAFEQKGVIKLPADAGTEEELFEIAVGAGAEDLTFDEDEAEWTILTERTELDVVRDAVEEAGKDPSSATLAYIPTQPKMLDGDDAEQCMQLYEALDDHDDCQNVYTDFDLTDEALAALG